MEIPNSTNHADGGNTRTGYVTLVGRPNAGKSTLMNALIGERLSIVTPKAQTTWQRVTGLLTTDRAQMIFLDTPGLLEPRDLLQRTMLTAAQDALQEADVILLVLDGSRGFRASDMERLAENLKERPSGPPPCRHQQDRPHGGGKAGRNFPVGCHKSWGVNRSWYVPRTPRGVEELGKRLEELLPPGPFLYPPDEVARDPVRFFVAEMIRETVFQEYHQEIPYSVFGQIEEFRENEDPDLYSSQSFCGAGVAKTDLDRQKRVFNS